MEKFNIRHEKFILMFHNRYYGSENAATSMAEIPMHCLEILGDMKLYELKRPFVVESLRADMPTRKCMRIYDLTESQVKAIGRRVGLRK